MFSDAFEGGLEALDHGWSQRDVAGFLCICASLDHEVVEVCHELWDAAKLDGDFGAGGFKHDVDIKTVHIRFFEAVKDGFDSLFKTRGELVDLAVDVEDWLACLEMKVLKPYCDGVVVVGVGQQ